MDMKIKPLTPVERKYTYTQSQQIIGQTSCIGHLRGDMDTDGNGFFTSWDDHSPTRNDDAFKAEFNAVINALRFDEAFGGILKDRTALAVYCRSNPASAFDGNYCQEYGFRVDTEKHSYLMRLNPSKGDYNFYVYAYVREFLDRHMEHAEKGIRFITPDYKELFRIPDGDQIRILMDGNDYTDRTCRYIDEYHLEVGNNLFHICEFAECMENNGNHVIPLRSSLPQQCFSLLPSTGEIIAIERGVRGYSTMGVVVSEGKTNREAVDAANKVSGVTRAQEAAMLAGSMFGWTTPGADPKNYNEDGTPIKPKHKDRGDAR